MSGPTGRNRRIGVLLRTNKLMILAEIVAVLLPIIIGIVITNATGRDTISLGGEVTALGGPALYLGLVASCAILWITSRLRGASWPTYGVSRPKSWIRTVLMGLGVALAVLAAVKIVIDPLLGLFPNLPPRDMSHFSPLTGSLPNLLIQLLNVWITAAFWEELQFRGYLMARLVDLLGRRTKLAWVVAAVLSSIIFGCAHSYQAPFGIIRTGAIGLVFALAYLVVGRNLWPLVLAHGLIDTLDMISHYLGG